MNQHRTGSSLARLVFALAIVAPGGVQGGLAPVPTSGPISGTGDGLNALWVGTTEANDPNSVASAEAVLALPEGDPAKLFKLEESRPTVNLSDGTVSGAGANNLPIGVGDAFSVLFSGFLNVTEGGVYTFSAYHDDGFRFNLGGVTALVYDGDTAPRTTDTSVSLTPGLYEFSYLGWEQGGKFVQELSWRPPSASDLEIIPSEALFAESSNAIPDSGSTLALLTVSLVGLALFLQRTRSGG